MDNSDQLANRLGALIQYLHEIIDGYAACEKRARNPDIKYIFYEFKLDRMNMQRQLSRLMPNDGYIQDDIDDLNFFLGFDNEDYTVSDEKLIQEICRVDRILMNKYTEVLQNVPQSPQIVNALNEHIQEIHNNLEFITTCKSAVDSSFYH